MCNYLHNILIACSYIEPKALQLDVNKSLGRNQKIVPEDYGDYMSTFRLRFLLQSALAYQ